MGLQQAAWSDQPLHSSADKQQVQVALGSEIQSQPVQAVPAFNAAAAAVLAASTDAEVADATAKHTASAPLPDTVKHAGADVRQQSKPDIQKGGHRASDAPPSTQSISDRHQGPEQLVSASQEDQKLAVVSTDVQGSRHRAGTPSGNRQVLQHQQHPRRRREFHDEPQPSGPGRKRSQTPEVEFGRDAKRSRHAWHPTPAHARHAEHGMPSQGASRYDAHRGPSSFNTKQGFVAPSHRYRDSKSPTLRSAGRDSVALAADDDMVPPGRRAETTRSMSISPSHANGRNPSLPGHLHGGTPGPHTAPHGRTWDPEVPYNSRGNAAQTSIAHPPRFDCQQDHRKASWSSKEYSKVSLLPREDSHHRDHHNEYDRRSRSTDRATHGRFQLPILDSLTPPPFSVTSTCQESYQHPSISSDTSQHASVTLLDEHRAELWMLMVADVFLPGKDVSRQRNPSQSEHEATGVSRAQKLDSDLDHMFAWLLTAYKRPFEAMGSKLVLQQMSSSVKLTEHIDGGGDDDDGKSTFMATSQVS